MGGIAEALCLQPIDVIKTRLQLDASGRYRGVAHCGATIAREEGARSLWKGLTPFATNLTLKYALRFSTNSFYQSLLRDKETGKLTDGSRMAAGFLAGVTEAFLIVTPCEVVKIRLQQQSGSSGSAAAAKAAVAGAAGAGEAAAGAAAAAGPATTTVRHYKGPLHCGATIVREEGLRGLWSGATPTIMRNGTNQMCLFWAKNHMDEVLWGKREGDGKTLAPVQSTVSGFLAACLGPAVTNPMDVVKTRMMAQAKAPPGAPRYAGFFDALVRIPRDEGMLALFWKGLLPRLMRIAPGQAIVWTVNDQIVALYEKGYFSAGGAQ
jgi:solute carrier family 25 citrate transporter 1